MKSVNKITAPFSMSVDIEVFILYLRIHKDINSVNLVFST